MAIERFYLIKDGKRDGPYDEPYMRFLLENDEISLSDYCEDEDGERMRLSELYEALDDDEEIADEEESDEEGDWEEEEGEEEYEDEEGEEEDEEDGESRRKLVRVLPKEVGGARRLHLHINERVVERVDDFEAICGHCHRFMQSMVPSGALIAQHPIPRKDKPTRSRVRRPQPSAVHSFAMS